MNTLLQNALRIRRSLLFIHTNRRAYCAPFSSRGGKPGAGVRGGDQRCRTIFCSKARCEKCEASIGSLYLPRVNKLQPTDERKHTVNAVRTCAVIGRKILETEIDVGKAKVAGVNRFFFTGKIQAKKTAGSFICRPSSF